MNLQFGEFIAAKRKEQGITLRGMADELNITAPYLSDIEKSRRNPPEIDTLERIVKILKLSTTDKAIMFDYAGEDRKQIAPDLPDYIMDLPAARTALRKARDMGKQEDFWRELSDKLDKETDDDK